MSFRLQCIAFALENLKSGRISRYSRYLSSRTQQNSANVNKSEGSGPTASKRPPFESKATFRLTEPRNPDWKYGDGYRASIGAEEWQQGEQAGWKSMDTSEMSPREIFPLMISGIVPRPIAFVSSISASGVPNLAPFSLQDLQQRLTAGLLRSQRANRAAAMMRLTNNASTGISVLERPPSPSSGISRSNTVTFPP